MNFFELIGLKKKEKPQEEEVETPEARNVRLYPPVISMPKEFKDPLYDENAIRRSQIIFREKLGNVTGMSPDESRVSQLRKELEGNQGDDDAKKKTGPLEIGPL